MDQATVDVTSVPGVEIGDAACLIGSDGAASWQADDVAKAGETISYEVLCAISARVPRRYRNL
jgi:alanine racemase